MTDVLRVLGQLNPTAAALTDIYTVPVGKQATISSIVVCNLSSAGVTFNMTIASGGAVDDPKQYIYYQMPLDSNDTFIATIGISLASGDVIRVLGSSGSVSFNIFGVEVS